jgi:NAD(P)-dependent dehydrogenase (short-subunit alcohol dehydrogenase family)
VNIGSGAGLAGVRTLPQAAHAAAKGAVLALTRQLAAEGIAVGIRVNSVSPGVMATPPVLAMYNEMGAGAPVAPVVERTITGRPGDPLAVAYAGLYLASEEAAWGTGTNIVVDGGASAIM